MLAPVRIARRSFRKIKIGQGGGQAGFGNICVEDIGPILEERGDTSQVCSGTSLGEELFRVAGYFIVLNPAAHVDSGLQVSLCLQMKAII